MICPNGELVVEDHPRLCGEKEADVQFLFHSLGSPPPMRGKVVPSTLKRKIMRITPAYAGKSITLSPFTAHGKDHPRLCGEKPSQHTPFAKIPGSPPPMRGKEWMNGLDDADERITPAYAGKSNCNLVRGCVI